MAFNMSFPFVRSSASLSLFISSSLFCCAGKYREKSLSFDWMELHRCVIHMNARVNVSSFYYKHNILIKLNEKKNRVRSLNERLNIRIIWCWFFLCPFVICQQTFVCINVLKRNKMKKAKWNVILSLFLSLFFYLYLVFAVRPSLLN